MKLSKSLSIIILITLSSFLYVHQQTEVFRLAYIGQKQTNYFEDLLDKNTILRYNLEKNASLVCIGNKVLKVNELQMPDNFRLVRFTSPEKNTMLTKRSLNKQNLVYRLFGVKRQAEAGTINPSVTLRIDGERSRTINSSIPPKD